MIADRRDQVRIPPFNRDLHVRGPAGMFDCIRERLTDGGYEVFLGLCGHLHIVADLE